MPDLERNGQSGVDRIYFPAFAEWVFEILDTVVSAQKSGDVPDLERDGKVESWLQPEVYAYLLEKLQASMLSNENGGDMAWIDHYGEVD